MSVFSKKSKHKTSLKGKIAAAVILPAIAAGIKKLADQSFQDAVSSCLNAPKKK